MTSVVKGFFGGASAADEAADVQRDALRRAEGVTAQNVAQIRSDLSPFREAGQPALQQFQALLGLGTPEEQQLAAESLIDLPGQQFLKEQGTEAILRGASATGGLGGGRVQEELIKFGTGVAQQDLQNRFARLGSLISGGQNAAAQTGQLSTLGTSNIANLINQQGQARASGILGSQQANAGLAQNLLTAGSFLVPGGSAIGGSLGAKIFSDERLKENIRDVDLKACFEALLNTELKAWNYLEEVGLGTDTHIGPIAQEAPDMIRIQDMGPHEMLDLHNELMMIAGALQFMKDNGMLKCH